MTDETREPAHGLFGPGIFGTGIDVSALDESTALRLGQWTGEQVRAAEQAGFLRGFAASADLDRDEPGSAQAYRVLLADAHALLTQAAENDALLDYHTVTAWSARLRSVLETGEYPGLATDLLDDPRDNRVGGGSEPS